MKGWSRPDRRRRQLEHQAYGWVVKIIDDADRHGPGLREWIGQDGERAAIYNRAYRAYDDARGPARAIYGTSAQRGQIEGVRPRSSRYRPALALATLLLLIAVGVALGATSLDGHGLIAVNNKAPPGPDAVLTTRVGELRTVALADGSKIILDTNSAILIRFDTSTRAITLDHGRARFAVAHDPRRPFIVSAGGATVTARGTLFDVDTAKDVQVHLISGAIDVRYPLTRSGSAPVQHLVAGQRIRLDRATDVPPPPVEAQPFEAQWTSRTRTFDDVPVSEVVAEANRYSDVKIVLESPIVATRLIFLDLDLRDTKGVADKLAQSLGLVIDQSTAGLIVLRGS